LSNRKKANRQCDNLINILIFWFPLRWLYLNLNKCSIISLLCFNFKFLTLKLAKFISNMTWFKLIIIKMRHSMAQKGKISNDIGAHRLKLCSLRFIMIISINSIAREWSPIHEKRTKKYVLLRIKSYKSRSRDG